MTVAVAEVMPGRFSSDVRGVRNMYICMIMRKRTYTLMIMSIVTTTFMIMPMMMSG